MSWIPTPCSETRDGISVLEILGLGRDGCAQAVGIPLNVIHLADIDIVVALVAAFRVVERFE